MKFFRPKTIFAVILAVSITARIASALMLGNSVEPQPGIFDQVSYHNLALRVLGGHGFTFDREWWPITRAGDPTAHWSYLYTGYLVVIYSLFGVNPLVARVIQAAAAGVLMPLLAYRIARRVFAPVEEKAPGGGAAAGIGIAAGGWVALYGYFIYYAGALMTETFYITGILWILDAALRLSGSARQRAGSFPTRGFLELGLAIALTALLRQVFLPFVPFLFAWLLLVFLKNQPFWGAVGSVARGGVISALVCAALIAPITLHNYQKFGSFVLINTNAGYAFFWSNHPVHGDSFVPLFTPDMPTYQELIPENLRHLNEARLDNALMALAMQEIAGDPARYLKLIISRIPAHFIFWPLPDSGLMSNAVRVLSFGVALPFMVVGLFLWLRMAYRHSQRSIVEVLRSDGTLLLLFMAEYTLIHLLSWAGIRYRLPQDAAALLFAAYPLYLLAMLGWSALTAPARRANAEMKNVH